MIFTIMIGMMSLMIEPGIRVLLINPCKCSWTRSCHFVCIRTHGSKSPRIDGGLGFHRGKGSLLQKLGNRIENEVLREDALLKLKFVQIIDDSKNGQLFQRASLKHLIDAKKIGIFENVQSKITKALKAQGILFQITLSE